MTVSLNTFKQMFNLDHFPAEYDLIFSFWFDLQKIRFYIILSFFLDIHAGLENSTRPLVFTSASSCRASEYFDISSEN